MSIRSTMLMFAVGCLTAGVATAEPQGSSQTTTAPNFQCGNVTSVQVACVGNVAVLPIQINIKDVRILDDSELSVLSDDLNKLSILNGDILDKNTILNNIEVGVLTDFLDKFDIDVTRNDVDVCTTILGHLFCK
jgi:hypothetical protein